MIHLSSQQDLASDADEIITAGSASEEDLKIEGGLRPQTLAEYIGQAHIKNFLDISIKAVLERGEPLEPVLLFGPPGLGKTTLAGVIAKELGGNLKVTSGPTLQRAGDLASIITALESGDVLFIDEIHRLPKAVEEILYPVMEDGVLDLLMGKGAGARSVRLSIPPVTIIGATTRPSLLSGPLRDRFGHHYRLEYYKEEEISEVLLRSARILNVNIEQEAAKLLAKRSRATPRIANRLLRRSRDLTQVRKLDIIDKNIAEDVLTLLELDALGLDRTDRAILKALQENFLQKPAGLEAIALTIGETAETLASVHEPYLLQTGLITRTPKGRMITEAGILHLNNF